MNKKERKIMSYPPEMMDSPAKTSLDEFQAPKDQLFLELAAPFTDEELEWRVLRKGVGNKGIWCMLAAYVTSRAIQNRLDHVVGPDKWQNTIETIEVTPVGGDSAGTGIVVGLGIRIDFDWIWKKDGADFSRGMEVTKSGISDGLKRAASLWGIGRYLYTIGEHWGKDIQQGYGPKGSISFKEGGQSYWCHAPKLGQGSPQEGSQTATDDLMGQPDPDYPLDNAPPPEPYQPKPQSDGGPVRYASEKQLKFIRSLLDKVENMAPQEKSNIEEALDGEQLTSSQASDLINSLKGRTS